MIRYKIQSGRSITPNMLQVGFTYRVAGKTDLIGVIKKREGTRLWGNFVDKDGEPYTQHIDWDADVDEFMESVSRGTILC